MERRLAAILACDVAGYSRAMHADETGTLERLKTCRRELIDPRLVRYRGRVIKLMGDGALVEFASAVDSVSFAVSLQHALAEWNAGFDQDARLLFRIGINVGDVIVDGDDIYGDGVNIAARLERLADPGGICIRRNIRNQVRDNLDLDYEDLGEIEVKNIGRPVRAFRIVMNDKAAALETSLVPEEIKPKSQRWLTIATALVGVFLLAFVTTQLWRSWSPEQAFQSSPIWSRASIAVLPFVNLSKDPSQQYFSDGITNDIITDLSKFHDLLVIASNSTFTYKDKPINALQVGNDLGVRYLLQGSVRRDEKRVRINIQLIDTNIRRHLWAERYDEAISDIFNLQHKIANRIVQTLAIRLTNIELKRISRKPTQNFYAYEYLLKGRSLLSNLSRKDSFKAREMFRRAINLDPTYASAYSGLGYTYLYAVLYGWAVSPNQALKKALELAQKSLALDQSDVAAHRLLGRIYMTTKQYSLSAIELEKAIALNPNDAASYADQGLVLVWSSRPEGAIRALKIALQLDPNMGEEGLFSLGLAYYLRGRYQDAIQSLTRAQFRNSNFVLTYVILAAAYGQMENSAGASRALKEIRRLDPFFSAKGFGDIFQNKSDAVKVIEGLRKAGLK